MGTAKAQKTMKIAAITHIGTFRKASDKSREDAAPETAESPKARDLVVSEPARSRSRAARSHWMYRPSVPCLAQMIAIRADLPQTRSRRRAAPDEAIAAYGAASAPAPAPLGERLNRTA